MAGGVSVGAGTVGPMTSPTARPAPPAPPTTITARSPEDLLAAGAVVLGFWPTESVVMLTFGAPHPFHARVDLPPVSDGADVLDDLAAALVRPAAHHRVGRVVLLLHTVHPARARAAGRALRSAFDKHGIAVVEVLLVTATRWWSLLDDTGEGPLGDGVLYDPARLRSHPFLAQAVVEGRVLHRTRDALAASLEPDAAACDRVASLAAALATRAPGALSHVMAQLAEGTWVQAMVDRHVAAPTRRAGDAEVARLLCAMQSLRVRDAAWSAVTRARARPAVAFFTDVLRRSPRELVPAPAALLAWAAWQAGDGALAWCALERCQEVDPGYGLAALVGEALERAVPPAVMAEGFDWKEVLDGRATG